LIDEIEKPGVFMSSSQFNEVLEAVEKLAPEDQEALIAILERRRIAQRRADLAKDIQEARREFQAGGSMPRKPAEIMQEILS
jgi:hypothetical protein